MIQLRIIFLIFLAAALAPLGARAIDADTRAEANQSFDQAAQAIAAARPAEALDLLRKTHDGGLVSAESFFLEGVAAHDAGMPAEALLAWRRALALDPGFREAAANARFTARQLGTPQPLPPEGWLEHLAALPRTAIIQTTIALAWLAAILLTARLFTSVLPAALATTVIPIAITAIVLSICGGGLIFAQSRLPGASGQHGILLETTSLQAAPARAAEPIRESLPPGTPLVLVASRGPWSYVELWHPTRPTDPTRGWIPSQEFHATSPKEGGRPGQP